MNDSSLRKQTLDWARRAVSDRAQALYARACRYLALVRRELYESELDAIGLYHCQRCDRAHRKGTRPCAPPATVTPLETPPPPAPPPSPEPPRAA